MYKSIFLVCLLFSGGCMSTFKNTVSAKDINNTDSRLYGFWKYVNNDKQNGDYGVIEFLPNKGILDIIIFIKPKDKNESPEVMYFKGYAEKNGKEFGLINFKDKNDDFKNKEEDYCLAKYVINENKYLKIYLLNEESLKKAVDEGILKGIKQKYSYYITSEKEEILKYLQEYSDAFESETNMIYEFMDAGFPK